MQESGRWWQRSDYQIVQSPSPPTDLHGPFPPLSPSLISLMVSVDVKQHVYLYTQSWGAVWKSRWSWAPRPNEPYGFCGRKATLNRGAASVLVTTWFVPNNYVNRHPRTWSSASSTHSTLGYTSKPLQIGGGHPRPVTNPSSDSKYIGFPAPVQKVRKWLTGHTPSIAFRHRPCRKDVNQCLEFELWHDRPISTLAHSCAPLRGKHFTVSVDVKQHSVRLRHWSQFIVVPPISVGHPISLSKFGLFLISPDPKILRYKAA